jgi:hypothetical protein
MLYLDKIQLDGDTNWHPFTHVHTQAHTGRQVHTDEYAFIFSPYKKLILY